MKSDQNTLHIREILELICQSYRVSCHFFTDQETNLAKLDNKLRQNIYPNFDYRLFLQELIEDLDNGIMYDVEDYFSVHYICFMEKESLYTILGPFLYSRPNAQKTLDGISYSTQAFEDISFYYGSLPIISDMFVWQNLIKTLLEKFYGKITLISRLSTQSVKSIYRNEYNSLIPDSSTAYEIVEYRYRLENSLLTAIREGDFQKAQRIGNEFLKFYDTGLNSSDSLRLQQDLVITSNTLFRKAAEEAYVPAIYLDALSQRAINQIEACSNYIQLYTLYTNLIRRYCLLIQSHSRNEYPALIRNIMQYIDYYYADRLTLTLIAKQFSVSRNYLSNLFHKKVGITLTDYIISIRLQHALKLLNGSDYSIQTISSECGFTDPNYFTRSFKKKYNITPQAYRKMLYDNK